MGNSLARATTVETASLWEPTPIQSLDETGLSHGFLQDMALKVLYFQGQITGYEIADYLHLPFQNVISKVMEFLKREQMCEIKSGGTLGPGTFQYLITDKGAAHARERMDRTMYVGPAPVPWEEYVASIKAQGKDRIKVNPNIMKRSLSHLVLEEDVFTKIGPAANSGKSIFLYGPPGNGKTTIAEAIGRVILTNELYIPYCVVVDGQIIQIYDAINHVIVPPEQEPSLLPRTSSSSKRDKRWIRIKRPVIMVGGELTLDGLELNYDATNKYYQAPFQMKANGGMFLIDDFGRQQVRPRDLLNRWIVPMEKKIDFLALHTGRKIEVPFEVLIVFSTNLPPRDLVDEAFLRRIRHKIEVSAPTYDGYREIFKRVCQSRGVPFDDKGVIYLLQEYYVKKNRKLRANHPRDILDQLQDICDYLGREIRLTKELLDQAAESYFVDL